jgi:exodeoxyribonuclease VII large subunit
LNLEGVDVIIVARGGGSIEELWTFNEEPVARAVFGSLIPVVSAVGHETDFTICDYVADLRAPTPSAAAELVVPDARQFHARLQAVAIQGLGVLEKQIDRHRGGIEALLARSRRGSVDLDRLRQRLDDFGRRGQRAVEEGERQRRNHLRRCLAQLDALNPQATLDRGYAVVHRAGRVVSSIAEVGAGDALVIKVADGGFPARVDAPGQRRARSRASVKRPSNGTNGNAGVQPVLFP